jgi:hypothetical protein
MYYQHDGTGREKGKGEGKVTSSEDRNGRKEVPPDVIDPHATVDKPLPLILS